MNLKKKLFFSSTFVVGLFVTYALFAWAFRSTEGRKAQAFRVGTETVSIMDTDFTPQSGRVNNIYTLYTEVGKLKMLEVYTRDNQKLAIPPAPGQEIEIGDIVDFHNIMVLGRVTSQLAFKTTNVALPMSQ